VFFFVAEKMVKIGLQLKALLENVTGIEAEGEDFRWDYILYSRLPLIKNKLDKYKLLSGYWSRAYLHIE
jgi:hypothetical protein